MPLPTSAPVQLTTPQGLLSRAGRLFLNAYTELWRGSPGRAFIMWGTGDPETVVPAPVGSLFCRTDGSAGATLYVKESGSNSATGWSSVA